MGQQRKNPPPPMKETTFMQNAISANKDSKRHAAKKHRELTVFLGDVHAWKLAFVSLEPNYTLQATDFAKTSSIFATSLS